MARPHLQPPTASETLKGIACLIAGGLFGTLNDAVAKLLTGTFPAGQILFVRGAFTLLIPIAFIVWRTGGLAALRVRDWGGQLLRAGLMSATTFLFIVGLSLLPLATVITLNYAAPLLITALAAPLLGERVGWRRWTAVGVGFGGILLIVRPGDATFALIALIPLASAAVGALKDIVTRRISATEGSTAVVTVTVATITLTGAATYPFGWAPLTADDLGLMALAGVFGGLSQYFQIEAFRRAEATVVAPFKYTTLVWAVLLGLLLWGEFPDGHTFAGAAVVIASGLYVVHRETVRRRAVPTAPVDRPPP